MAENDCVFCRIASGAVPCHRVYGDELVLAFLDRGAIRPGHTQIIPRAHYAYFDDVPLPLLSEIAGLGQRLARAMKELYGVRRVAFAFTGGDIAHAHAHLVPMLAKDDITSRRYIVEESVTYRNLPFVPDDEQVETARRLSDALEERLTD